MMNLFFDLRIMINGGLNLWLNWIFDKPKGGLDPTVFKL